MSTFYKVFCWKLTEFIQCNIDFFVLWIFVFYFLLWFLSSFSFSGLFFSKVKYFFSSARLTVNVMIVELKMDSLRRIKASYSLFWMNNCSGACWAAGTLVARALHWFSESPLPPFSPIQSSTSFRRCVSSHLLIMQWHRFTSSSNRLVNQTKIKFIYLK